MTPPSPCMAINSCRFNAHCDERCYLPIHVYDANTNHCVVTILRRGKTPNGEAVRAHLRH
jgi:Transposase DDE domain group 1